MTDLLLLPLMSACAGFVQRVSGFGFGIFIMMFLPYIMPSYKEAVALSGLLSAATALFIVARNFRYIRWRCMPVVLFFNILVSCFVVVIMDSQSASSLFHCLGVVLVAVAFYFLFFEKRMKMRFVSWYSRCLVGAVSGFMGAMFGMPGPAVVLYGINVIRSKKEYMATMQAFWILFNLFYMLFRSGGGYYTSETPLNLLLGCVGVFAGIYLGARLFGAVNAVILRRIVYCVMLLSGVAAMLK